MIYGTAKNFCFYGKKKVSFFSFKVIEYFFQFYFDQIEIQKNLAFFELKHGFTPLEKCDSWEFEHFYFHSQKNNACFLFRILLNLNSSLILGENK